MIRRLAFALAVLAACPNAAAQPAPYQLVDLSDDFTAFYDRTEGMATEARVAAFKAEIVPLFPQFYGRQRFADIDDAAYDTRIRNAIDRFPRHREAYVRKASSFSTLLAPAYASFVAAFPDMADRPIGDIYLLHSLGEMDGGTRGFDNRSYLIFGADVMARSHPYEDEEPFFHHELFHIYHQRFFNDCGAVWCALWIEGLAVYASRVLNEDATDEQMLLTVPEPIPAPVDANLTEAVCEVRARLQSRTQTDLNALFSFSRLNERLPPRFGYYVGYLAAREAGRTHTLQQLAQMRSGGARRALKEALANLASCDGR